MSQVSSKTFASDFTTGRILPHMVSFALPLFLANLLQAVYNVVDMIVVGRVVGETGLSAVSVGGDVLSLLTFLAVGFAGAGQIIIAQYVGAGRKDRLSRFIGTMSSFLLLGAFTMSLVCLLLRRQILGILNTPPEAWEQTMAYATTCIFGLIFIYGYNIVSSIMRGMGDSKRPLLFIAIAAVLNLLLDLLFVGVFHWKAFGAALATVIAQGTSFLTALVYLYTCRGRFGFTITPRSFLLNKTELITLVKLGVPMAIRSASVLVSKLFCNAWINSYGVTISAVTGVGHKVDLFGNLLGQSIAASSSSMIGQNMGAGKYDRISRILGAAMVLNAVCFSLAIAVVALFPNTVFGIFTDDPAVLLVCMEYVPVAIITFVAGALRDSMFGFTNGCGNYKLNFVVAIIDGVIARIGFSFFLGAVMGLAYYGFWMGNAVAGSMPFLIGGAYFLFGHWRKESGILKSE